jgi:RES domain-containing protein
MIVYRITGHKYAGDISGAGAALHGGRWNKKGSRVMYTGGSKEIALLEVIAHTPPMLVPKLDILKIEIPDESITVLTAEQLPLNWADYPAPTVLSEIGEEWIQEGRTVALSVPSCIIRTSNNFILNCGHPAYSQVKILDRADFHFDARLVGF